ncbi:HD domain-containing protein, partial [Candidatus Uhrbacteria bacterium]|nr:HD domain-containing protein [Candidatus Uhrbacteria bacterium]MBD3283860.1 HD domain-containing protein [Candidatus Uhrbacteria bacterium]
SKALAFSESRHEPHQRLGGSPYLLHLLRTANILMDEWQQREGAVIAAALLHDVVEDTQTTIKEVKDAFGSEVGALVDGMTMWKGSESHEVYLKRISRGPEVLRVIKCADTLDNLRSWHECIAIASDRFPDWWKRANYHVLPMARKMQNKAAVQLEMILEDRWYLTHANMI